MTNAKETTFTPGPWIAQDTDPDQWTIYSRGVPLYSRSDVASFVREADARLIAAAPELYEALTLIKRFGELACVDAGLGLGGSSGKKPASKDVFQFPRHLLTDIDAALSKARGEDRSQ